MSDNNEEFSLEDIRQAYRKRKKIQTLEEAIVEINNLIDKLDRIDEALVDLDIKITNLLECCRIQVEIYKDKEGGKENA